MVDIIIGRGLSASNLGCRLPLNIQQINGTISMFGNKMLNIKKSKKMTNLAVYMSMKNTCMLLMYNVHELVLFHGRNYIHVCILYPKTCIKQNKF